MGYYFSKQVQMGKVPHKLPWPIVVHTQLIILESFHENQVSGRKYMPHIDTTFPVICLVLLNHRIVPLIQTLFDLVEHIHPNCFKQLNPIIFRVL